MIDRICVTTRNNCKCLQVLFSLDYGACWKSVPLSPALLVENIRIEPDGQRPKVVVHGRACTTDMHPECTLTAATKTSKRTTPGLLYALDISQLMGACQQCQWPLIWVSYVVRRHAASSLPFSSLLGWCLANAYL